MWTPVEEDAQLCRDWWKPLAIVLVFLSVVAAVSVLATFLFLKVVHVA